MLDNTDGRNAKEGYNGSVLGLYNAGRIRK